MLERMPVIDRNSPGHTNGESAGGTVKEIQPTKPEQGELKVALEPANQVHDDGDDHANSLAVSCYSQESYSHGKAG